MRSQRSLAIIGAGLGGLSAALHARARGWSVDVFEQSGCPGGKCNRFERDGFQFDTGPSLLTLPEVVAEPFAAVGQSIEDHLEWIPVEPGCTYHFHDGTIFHAPGTLDAFEEALIQQWPSEADGWHRFRRTLTGLWELSGPAFLFNPLKLSTLRKIPWGKIAAGFAALRPESMRRSIERHFRDPNLRTLFSRFATYNGSDPWRTPATFNVIPYAELAFGSWTCRGGLFALVRALESVAISKGVRFHYNTPVSRVTFDPAGKANGLTLDNGRHHPCDAVICNADAVQARVGELLTDHPRHKSWVRRYRRAEPSLSGFVALAARPRTTPDTGTHNVFFPADYRREFTELFETPQPLSDPTLYLSISARHSPEMAPEGQEGWFILANAPSLRDHPQWDSAAYADFLHHRLCERLDLRPEDSLWTHGIGPHHLATATGAWHGTIYGPASNSRFAAFARVPNADPRARIGFAGGSAHPGGGIPLTLLSGRHAVEGLSRT